jgi:DNA-binding PadR family transcriptional regulator
MASIHKREDGAYRARWREYPGGPQKTRQFARKGDAQTFLDGVRGDLARGVYIDPAGARVLFRDYAESWRAAQVHRRSTAIQAETYLRLHAYPTLGRRPIGAILRSEIQAWVKSVSGSLAPGSVEVVYRWVSTIFKAAVGYGVIQSVAELSAGRVRLRAGTVYGALDRLEGEGLVVADGEEVEQGRTRRYYRITPGGLAAVEAETERMSSNVKAARRRLTRVQGTVEVRQA